MAKTSERFSAISVIFGLIMAMAMAMAMALAPGSANAELWDTAYGGGGFKKADRRNWRDNYGNYGSDDSAVAGAIEWCKTTPDYKNPAIDCTLHPSVPVTITWIWNGHSSNSAWVLNITLYRNAGFSGNVSAAWWPPGTTDDDCSNLNEGDVIDRVQGYNCIPAEDQYVLEEPDQNTEMCEGNPCDPSSGNKTQREIDYRGAGTGTLSFSRYYNSRSAYKTGVGMSAGWRHTYSRELNEPPERKPSILFAAPPQPIIVLLFGLRCVHQWL